MTQYLRAMRDRIVEAKRADEDKAIDALAAEAGISDETRRNACRNAESLINEIRSSDGVGRIDSFLVEYGLDTEEGIALLRLSEALMRVPDSFTADALIADKLSNVDWNRHRGRSKSSFVNLATLAMAAGAECVRNADSPVTNGPARKALRNLSAPAVRLATRRAVGMLANRFVIGKTMEEALSNSAREEREGFCHSYDMLGEAALTAVDADNFFEAYKGAIRTLALRSGLSSDCKANHSVSIKLSALHPRYELAQRERVLDELRGRLLTLARMAKDINISIDIDAEESERLELSLDLMETVLGDPGLAGWDGFGVVVQAYGKAAPRVIDYLNCLAEQLDRKIKIRLVKGAYWDSEIKRAQVEGIAEFPVYTRKAATDVSYLCCAKKLIGMTDRIYPQFAGHNAHTVSAILELAGTNREFEFQRIYGMGGPLHSTVLRQTKRRCRVYAPVGNHRELLPYLARRMLENGANSSFVNQIADPSWTAREIARDPFDALADARKSNIRVIARPPELFGNKRENSKGWDLRNPGDLAEFKRSREPYSTGEWSTGPIIAVHTDAIADSPCLNPADSSDIVGRVERAGETETEAAFAAAKDWGNVPPRDRAAVLRQAARLYEARSGEIFALLAREAGKTMLDAVAELREAVDFLRHYAAESENLGERAPLGLMACISPWNFPLAIFTGQVSGALAAGNGVLAKPADQTPLTAAWAVELMHEAGVPRNVLQLLPGPGSVVGEKLASDPRTGGIVFTGSTATANRINRTMAESGRPTAPLIAETGGLNAMIVDSTALPEQVVADIIVSAFQSAGQRCSATRMLYLQNDVADTFLTMLYGAMDELRVGNPWEETTDIGPLISDQARAEIERYLETARAEGRLLKRCAAPKSGNFLGPAVLKVGGIEDLEEEVFGPVLHVATYQAKKIDQIVNAINAKGYGLTFGMHSRIDSLVKRTTERLRVGNMYVNRNQIGAVVGSQPFGGEGMSGTGPKAGGLDYVRRFTKGKSTANAVVKGEKVNPKEVERIARAASKPVGRALRVLDMPGPTGESNRLSYFPRGTVLCLGPTVDDAEAQAAAAAESGCPSVKVAPGVTGSHAISGFLDRSEMGSINGFSVVALWSDEDDVRAARRALSSRQGPLIPLITSRDVAEHCLLERHICVDTTAAGGNATLYAAVTRDSRPSDGAELPTGK